MYKENYKILSPNDPNFTSINQKLAGPPNPKTLIKPVVIPPPTDIEFWKANNLINHSHINTQSQWDTYLSGYDVSTCCNDNEQIIEDFEYIGISDSKNPVKGKRNPLNKKSNQIIEPTPVTTIPLTSLKNRNIKEGYETFTRENTETNNILQPVHLQHIETPQPQTLIPNMPVIEDFKYPYLKDFTENSSNNHISRTKENGLINTSCGYNQSQLKNNLPSNLPAGMCEQNDQMKKYNKNLFTQNIQPDIYTTSEVIEPINSNIGISFNQQKLPTTFSLNEDEVIFTEHDPNLFTPETNTYDNTITESDVYDPRFYGYGTSYRSYTDDNIGQTRFYYDDINSIRMPNYLVRSNIDFAIYADSYGPLNDNNKNGNKHNKDIRTLAQDTFLNSSLQQRTELQQRLMSKRNNEMWQLRKFPKHKFF